MQSEIVKSPLNYTGGKYKLLPQLLPLFPKNINTMVDLFCGGCNVGVNVSAKSIVSIDSSSEVIGLINTFKAYDKNIFIDMVEAKIKEYGLSLATVNGYEYYDCNGSDGLSKFNKDKFIKLRADLNQFEDKKSQEYFLLFYILILYSFNNQIRFNSKNQFNIPAGKRDFNSKAKDNLIKFIDKLKTLNILFMCDDFRNTKLNELGMNDFLYADPPYLITTATYNEQGGWAEKDELDLYNLLDVIDSNGVKFALSNVLECKGRSNNILKTWSKRYNINFLDFNYNNSNYHINNKTDKSIEVLVTNYKV